MTALTSARLTTVASDLATLRDALGERVADFDDAIGSTRTALDLLGQTWRGPLPDQMDGEVSTYVDAVAGAVGAAESARATVDAWATAATAASGRLAELERSLANTDAAIAAAVVGDAVLLGEDRRRIAWAISEEVGAWSLTCTTKGQELDSAIRTLRQCSLTEMGTVDQRSALLGDSYSTAMAAWAAQHDMELSLLDPTGAMKREADERLAAFADSEYANLLYAVVETMNQADISKMDGESSHDDWLLSTDPDVVRFRLEVAARLAGIELSEAQLDGLTSQIITTAVFGAATDEDGRDAADDQFDENTDIEAALDEGQPAEHEFEFPENPTGADQYVQAWLAAQWQGDPGIFDYAKMILIPDFAVMNPWSDEFQPGWAVVEIVGIIPWGKAGKLLSLARLGSHADEMADAVRLFDDGIDILSDSGRVADDILGAGDDVLAAGDDVLAAGDEVAGAGDDVAGIVDDVPASRLPQTDPRIIAEIDEVRSPVLDSIQTEIDRIWTETQDALPGASPQQLGTRAHRELEAWISEHADELIDPETGYRVRAEISFDADGLATNRGAPGSIRPDVIIERRVVDADGISDWEVVEVADLKTGQAGISASWQARVDHRLDPVHTTELRPNSPTPVPE